MKVLHYIPNIKVDDLVSDYVKTLTSSMKNIAEVHIVTSKENVAKTLKTINPDIVHIHSCWDYATTKVIKTVAGRGVAVVLSPHNGLEPYTMKNEQRITKQVKRAAYQYRAVAGVDALIATSTFEYDSLVALGWNKHVGMVLSPILNRNVTAPQMAENAFAYYNKILDTRYFLRMASIEKEAVCHLLHTSKTRNSFFSRITEEHLQQMRSLGYEQWRRILMYADDEGVRPLIDTAIRTLRLNVPQIDTQSIDRYKIGKDKDTEPLESTKLLGGSTSVADKLSDEIGEGEELLRTITVMVLNIRYHLRANTLSMRHIADLYDVIRYEDYDEDRLVKVLKRVRTNKLATRLLQLETEYFYLTEGFLPLLPLDDNGTQAIRNILLH